MTRLGIATFMSAGAGYSILLLAARSLSPVENAEFLTYWAFLFIWFGILTGFYSETTRATHRKDGLEHPDDHPRVVVVALLGGVSLAVVLTVTSPIWSPVLFSNRGTSLTPWLCIAVIGCACHLALMGSLVGQLHVGTAARLVTTDALVRVLLGTCAFLFAASVAGYAAATALTSLGWFLFLGFSARARSAIKARADVSIGGFLGRLWHACVASAASSALLVGFPVLLRLTSSEDAYLASAPLILAIALTRAPLMIPLTAYQGVAITHFLRNSEKGIRALLPIAMFILSVGFAGGLLAGFVGPWMLRGLAGPSYDLSGVVLAGLTLGGTALALLTLTGVLCQARDQHRACSIGWIASVGLAIVLLALPANIEARTVLSLIVAPILGIAIHVGSLHKVDRRRVQLSRQ